MSAEARATIDDKERQNQNPRNNSRQTLNNLNTSPVPTKSQKYNEGYKLGKELKKSRKRRKSRKGIPKKINLIVVSRRNSGAAGRGRGTEPATPSILFHTFPPIRGLKARTKSCNLSSLMSVSRMTAMKGVMVERVIIFKETKT